MAIESSDWYIENVHTKNINLLNKGEFSIGRREDNNLIIDGRFMKHCSRKHCIITLKDDTVRILNTVSFYPRFFFNDFNFIALEISNKIDKRHDRSTILSHFYNSDFPFKKN